MEPLVCAALRGGLTLEALKLQYGVNSRRGVEFPNLVSLKYDQIEGKMAEPLVQQCRGLILDEASDWSVVARPFDKFWNSGEALAAQIDWSSATFQEKLDGSLIIMYHYAGEWRVGTSGTPDASGEVNGTDLTFAQLFWKVWRELGYTLPTEGLAELTLMFELTTPFNRVVVRHTESKITLIGIRDNVTGQEYPVTSFRRQVGDWERIRSFPLKSLDEAIQWFDVMDPLQQEGYVVVDAAFNRVKVKHPGYIALHHMRGEGVFNSKRALQVVLANETTEVGAAFPEWKPLFAEVAKRLGQLAVQAELDYSRLREIPIQKDFALEALKTKVPAALFEMRKKPDISALQFLKTLHIDKLSVLLKLDEVKL